MPESRITISDLGYTPGQLKAGPKNSILDVPGVLVGQNTIGNDGDDARKGVTVIFPRHPDSIHIPCYAAFHTLNGNGEVTGSYQVRDFGYTNTPLALTNSCSLGTVFQSIWSWTLERARRNGTSLEDISQNYGTPVVGETCDWMLNDVFKTPLTSAEVAVAFDNALEQKDVQEGQFGGGAGMTCHMFPGGTGTSSRVFGGEDGEEEFTVGVICQSNYGHTRDLSIGGVPIGKLILKERQELVVKEKERSKSGKIGEGSIVIFLITNAPLLPHQLERVARHCAVGLAQVGGHGVGRNYSGDIILALSTGNTTNEFVSTPQVNGISKIETNDIKIIKNESIETLFRAASEATEEAILNSMIAGRDGRTGNQGFKLDGLPIDRVRELLQKYLVPV